MKHQVLRCINNMTSQYKCPSVIWHICKKNASIPHDRDWLESTSPKWPTLCWVGCKTSQSHRAMNTEYNSLSVSRANTQMKVSIHTAGYMHTAGIRVRARVRVSSGELHVFLISHHPAMSTGHAMISNYMHFNYTHGFPCVQHRCTQIQAYSNKHIHTPTDRQTHRDIQRHRRTDDRLLCHVTLDLGF